ncbi:MAG: OmpH family outer membrane protein [Alistipes sp.]|nr:OmpH family outer membrane protein [Alistipes sp.]MBO7195690.1 OmpH family outer membrane protein [Alistipes sp.]
MKRMLLTIALILGLASVAMAQNYAVVNSEKIFKSIEGYNTAIAELDRLANDYQAEVDRKFEEVETLYNKYMERREQLNVASQQATEQKILEMEQEATQYQESIFGTDGTLMKKRLEMIQPIQKAVFAAIEEYAKLKGFDMIIDISQNATMLYYSSKADHTQAVIDMLKK